MRGPPRELGDEKLDKWHHCAQLRGYAVGTMALWGFRERVNQCCAGLPHSVH